MGLMLSLALCLTSADAERAFTSPKSETPQHGHGLTKLESEAGWISLFDGQTNFGWTGAKVVDGQLIGGETTSVFGDYEIEAEVITGGELVLGGEKVTVAPGEFRRRVTGKESASIKLDSGIRLKNVNLRPTGMQSFFDGKTLEGWTVLKHPRLPEDKQAKWRVENAAIRGKGGPGALELKSRLYGDLVLQVEVATRAQLVNGGIFMRAIPGQFMNGYEAQLFNACYERDPAKPARYSTGAIDDRQLARRLVSRDQIPFVMTVIASGPHIATWVNGYQTTDWTDTRSLHENPRAGLRLKPGAIQLQAHDPQTDIEFRRIQIGALK